MIYEQLKDIPSSTTGMVLLLGVVGSLLNYSRRQHKSLGLRLILLLGDLVSSTMLSIVVFYTIVGGGGSEILAVGTAGMVAHQGTRALYLLEAVIASKLGLIKELKDGLNK